MMLGNDRLISTQENDFIMCSDAWRKLHFLLWTCTQIITKTCYQTFVYSLAYFVLTRVLQTRLSYLRNCIYSHLGSLYQVKMCSKNILPYKLYFNDFNYKTSIKRMSVIFVFVSMLIARLYTNLLTYSDINGSASACKLSKFAKQF